jgi:hypothetical protein
MLSLLFKESLDLCKCQCRLMIVTIYIKPTVIAMAMNSASSLKMTLRAELNKFVSRLQQQQAEDLPPLGQWPEDG